MCPFNFLAFIEWLKKKTRILLDYIKIAHANLDQKNQISVIFHKAAVSIVRVTVENIMIYFI